MNDQPLHAKRDKFLGRETAEIAQFVRFRNAGCDVLGAKYRRERQVLAR
jgi:hypothetical protein